jgi:signal transduction histidine kinase
MNPSPDRDRTDASLRLEREKTDQAVAARQENVARHADAVVDRARENADAVLDDARETADAVLDAARDREDALRDPGGREETAALAEERELADEALRDERECADDVLRAEREQYAHAMRRFLPLERESTDRYLRSERIRSDRALVNRDDFLAIVTHDLRDLLSGIVLSSTVLSKHAPQERADGTTLAETRRIKRYAARMSRLIGDLVDIASIDAGKLAVEPAPGNVALLIAEAADAFQAAAVARGIVLESRIDAAPLPASFDHDRILQVLGNLISNALKYTPKGGKITLVGERDGAGVRLSVSDTGPGIPEDALESVFERFSQVGSGDRGGLGLGLYISRCLVKAQGGKIWAQRRPGAGSALVITLPG